MYTQGVNGAELPHPVASFYIDHPKIVELS